MTRWGSGNDCLVLFNTCKIKLITFHYQRADFKPMLVSRHIHREAPSFEHFRLEIEDLYSVPSQKMLNDWSVYCIALENTGILLLFSIFTRVISDQEWIIAGISGLVLRNPHCPVSGEFKCAYEATWVMKYSPTCNPLSHRQKVAGLSLIYHLLLFLSSTNSDFHD